jgi:hypothetical protein
LASSCLVFLWGRFCGKRRSAFCQRHHGTILPEPLAKPPGRGLSSATVNVVWGFFNAVVAYLLVERVGVFNPRTTIHIVAFGLGALLISIPTARHFGQFHGGNTPRRP